MRRTTAWALGGMLAGTVLLGTGGTMATFSDTESLSATAGAGSLALADPSPSARRGTQQLMIGPKGAVLPVRPDVAGTGTAMLRLSAVDPSGGNPCDVPIILTVTLPLPAAPVEATLCTLTGEGVDLLPVDAGTPDLTLPVSASVVHGVGPAAQHWSGDLRITLVQADEGGFSDEQRVPVRVVAPNAQGNGRTG
jgi:predicted ribosomally synthesized peptide with SipW-like signal peptide